ncbi:MAG: isochorismatase family protein [Verrucomicrobiaceae bacterium]|nr:isochorismatase family protein [Verrucomicrobiaceae bacterium]
MSILLAVLLNASEPLLYNNRLRPIENASPLLADHPNWVEPIRETNRFEAAAIINDANADLHVRAWRWSYNARGIIEMPNHLRARHTAVIMVHPWGIDDGQGWETPEPAGVCSFCAPEKNHLAAKHTREVIAPFHASLRGKFAAVLHSLPGNADPIRAKAYRTLDHTPTEAERLTANAQLRAALQTFDYSGESLPKTLRLDQSTPVASYFQQFPGLDASARFNNAGFWQLPIPLTVNVQPAVDDIVIFDGEGYTKLRDWLKAQQIRHILLTGYATDLCFANTCAGYVNLSRDFNVFLVGDATLATFPAHTTPSVATSAHIASASLNQLITQVSWITCER